MGWFVSILLMVAAALVSSAPSGSRSRRYSPLLVDRTAEHAAAHRIRAGPPLESENVASLLRTLRRFKGFATSNRKSVEERHKSEGFRLHSAINQTRDGAVQLALGRSATSNTQSMLETQRVYSNMVKFADSMESLLTAATATGYGCEQMTCDQHASCTPTTQGAQCVCNEGYLGTGQDCDAPPEFLPRALLDESAGGSSAMQAAEVNVAVFGGNKIAVVFRAVSMGDVGVAVVGSVREAGMVDMAPPEQFTPLSGKAFHPVVAGTDDKRILIAWRDENRGGTGWIRGGALGVTGLRGTGMSVSWGDKVNVARDQAHKMSVVPLPSNRIAVMFADKVLATQHTPTEAFGNAVLLDVGERGGVTTLGTFRFSDYAVCRLEVTKVTPTAFIVAARGARAVDDMDSSVSTDQEAMAVYGEMVDSDLVFDPHPVNLEPTSGKIWARGVSLIAPNTFAYAYQHGADSKVMLAVVEIDPTTHRMKVASGPSTIHNGFSPYVSMLSVPYTPADPHTLTYFEDGGMSKVSICSWNTRLKTVSKCEDFTWLPEKLTSVSGVHLGGGKSFMVFTTESGAVYHGVFGLSKK